MKDDKKQPQRNIDSDDNVSHNAHYDKSGEPSQFDERDLNKSSEEWDAEKSRTGRNK